MIGVAANSRMLVGPVDSGEHREPCVARPAAQRGRDTPLNGAGGPTQRGRRRNSTGPSLQVGQLGPDAELGGAPEHRVDVGVDDLDHLARQLAVGGPSGCGSARAAQRGLDLVEALPAVREVVVERGAARRRAPGRGRARSRRSRARRRARAAARASRGRRRAGRRGGRRPSCPGRAPCRRSAPRSPRQHERQRVGGVARAWPTTRTSSPSTSTTSPSPRPSAPSRYAGSSARTPQPTRSANCLRRLGVVEVVVGEQHDARRRRPPPRPRRGAPRPAGPGRRRPTGRRRARAAPRCWCRRASSCRGWAPARSAPARRTCPPAQLTSAASRQRRRAAAPGIDSSISPVVLASAAGREHLEVAPGRGGEHVGRRRRAGRPRGR